MRIDVITIFPEYLDPLKLSLVGKARTRGGLDVGVHDLRRWTRDRHHTVDDTPYGGGPGMVMKPDPWGDALDTVLTDGYERGARWPTMVVPTPSGRPFTQERAVELSERPWLIFTPARYEGIDRRVIDEYATRLPLHELSIGDYVLAGGEAAVLVMVEAVARLLPGVLGNAESHRDDSFAPGAMAGLLEGPVYTKPPQWRGRGIPEVLVSGHHGRIARSRRDEALRRTAEHRPELIERGDPASFDRKDRETLSVLGWQPGPDGRFVRLVSAPERDTTPDETTATGQAGSAGQDIDTPGRTSCAGQHTAASPGQSTTTGQEPATPDQTTTTGDTAPPP